jgi:hypothetical protein
MSKWVGLLSAVLLRVLLYRDNFEKCPTRSIGFVVLWLAVVYRDNSEEFPILKKLSELLAALRWYLQRRTVVRECYDYGLVKMVSLDVVPRMK